MDIIRAIVAAFAATSVMTLFSYICATARSQQFREPELLNQLISRSATFSLKLPENHFAGWIIHYAIGFIFVLVLSFLWNYTELQISLLTGGILGFLLGLVGIGGWKIMFSLNANPPKIELKPFFIQLILAHILFGATIAIVFNFS